MPDFDAHVGERAAKDGNWTAMLLASLPLAFNPPL